LANKANGANSDFQVQSAKNPTNIGSNKGNSNAQP